MARREAMSSRERLVAALHQRPVDRVPFDPRVWYARSGDAAFDRMTALEKAAFLECDLLLKVPYDQDQYHVRRFTPGVEIVERKGTEEHAILYRTPDGELVRRDCYRLGTWHPVEYPVKSVEDLKAMRHVYRSSRYRVDPATMADLQRIVESCGDAALPVTGYVTSPYMELVERIVGLENLVWLLQDQLPLVEELMELMHQDQLRKLEALLPHTRIQYVFSMENTTIDLAPPDFFRRYCLPHLTEYGRLIGRHGKFHLLHMCGKIKRLLPDIDRIPALAIDAFSPPPTGDTTFRDGVTGCPSKALLGGTNMTWWLNPERQVAQMIRESLACAGRQVGLVLQGPWEFAEGITPRKIRDVWRAVRAGLDLVTAAG